MGDRCQNLTTNRGGWCGRCAGLTKPSGYARGTIADHLNTLWSQEQHQDQIDITDPAAVSVGEPFLVGDFRGQSFQHRNLSRATLGQRSKFDGCDFTDADMAKTNGHRVSFTRSKFGGTDLGHSVLRGCDFRDADLSTAMLVGADFNGSRYNAGTRFPPGYQPETEGWLRSESTSAPVTGPTCDGCGESIAGQSEGTIEAHGSTLCGRCPTSLLATTAPW